jgi:hypothetical protein
MIYLTWFLGIAATLGTAGTIAALVLAPAVAMPILQKIVAFVISCRPCLYAAAAIGACLASWWFGHHQAELDCRAGELAAVIRNQAADLEAAKQSAADEAARATTIEATANDQHQKDADYIAALKASPSCALDGIDLPGGVPDDKSRPGRAKPAGRTW